MKTHEISHIKAAVAHACEQMLSEYDDIMERSSEVTVVTLSQSYFFEGPGIKVKIEVVGNDK